MTVFVDYIEPPLRFTQGLWKPAWMFLTYAILAAHTHVHVLVLPHYFSLFYERAWRSFQREIPFI